MILKRRTIPQLKTWTHLKFCKRYLEIRNKAYNVIDIYKNIIHCLFLLRRNEDTIGKQAFNT